MRCDRSSPIVAHGCSTRTPTSMTTSPSRERRSVRRRPGLAGGSTRSCLKEGRTMTPGPPAMDRAMGRGRRRLASTSQSVPTSPETPGGLHRLLSAPRLGGGRATGRIVPSSQAGRALPEHRAFRHVRDVVPLTRATQVLPNGEVKKEVLHRSRYGLFRSRRWAHPARRRVRCDRVARFDDAP